MEYDYDAQNRKMDRLRKAVGAELEVWSNAERTAIPANLQARLVSEVLQTVVSSTPPEKPEGPRMHMVVMGPHGFGPTQPVSRRLGNVRYNLRSLFKGSVTLALAVGAQHIAPFAIPLIALRAFSDLTEATEVKLTETEAAIAWTMWQLANNDNIVDPSPLLEHVNAHLSEFGRSRLTQNVLDSCLIRLERVDFIERSQDDPSKWWLRDWIQVKYS